MDLLGPGRLEAARRPGGTATAGRRPGTGRWRRTGPGAGPNGVYVTTACFREPPVPTKPPRRRDGRCPERGPPETPKPETKPGFGEPRRIVTKYVL